MNKTMTRFGMFTTEGDEQLKELTNKYLAEMPVTPFDITRVVYDFYDYVKANHKEFRKQHSEYTDTDVREMLYVYFEATLNDGFYKFIGSK